MTFSMALSAIIFVIAYIIIITEKIDRVIVAIAGGLAMVLLNLLTQDQAFSAIDLHTLSLLIGMMVIVMITARTGIFEYISIKMVKLAKGEPWKILVLLSVITAVISSVLDNVTTIMLVLPVSLDICKELRLKYTPFIISLVFASNIGGTATLIGDPPNIMIAEGSGWSFMYFIKNNAPLVFLLLIVTIFSFLVIYRKQLHAKPENKQKVLQRNEKEAIKDKSLMIKSLIIIGLTVLGFVLHDKLAYPLKLVNTVYGHNLFHFKGSMGYPTSTIAVAGAVILLLISKIKTEKVFKEIEWKTLFFFAGLFMLVEGIKKSGLLDFIARNIVDATGENTTFLVLSILWLSAIASAFLDNIPFTATMIPIIQKIGILTGISLTPLWLALSLGACLGGNGTIIGASANVVASGMAEEMGHKITFRQYFKVSFPLTLLTIGISTLYLLLFYL